MHPSSHSVCEVWANLSDVGSRLTCARYQTHNKAPQTEYLTCKHVLKGDQWGAEVKCAFLFRLFAISVP